MFKLVVISVICHGSAMYSGTDLLNTFDLFLRKHNYLRNDAKLGLDLSNTSFPVLENYEVNATPVSETKYPWIARVVHSRTLDIPHMCTAVCIDRAIFITAARCIHTLKVSYTSIIYGGQHLSVLAFVLPSEMSKQAFDDIGFIVINKDLGHQRWNIINLLNYANRTNHAHSWFVDKQYTRDVKVVGYAAKKGIHKIRSANRHYNLTELNVLIGLDICPNILTPGYTQMFRVPCYYTCSDVMLSKNQLCKNYHGVEGGAVIDSISNKLLGIATWGAYYAKSELPVGFTFANSEKFFKDYACARKIRDSNRILISKGYQRLCD